MSPEKSALDELLSAAPSFRPVWRGSLGTVPDVTDAVGQLVEHLGAGEVMQDELAVTLNAAERLLHKPEGLEAVRVASELIEDLQLLASYPDVGLEAGDVEAVLPLACREQWDALDAKWRAAWDTVGDRSSAISLDQYSKVSDPGVRRLVRTTCRVMADGRLVSIADVLRWEADNPLK